MVFTALFYSLSTQKAKQDSYLPNIQDFMGERENNHVTRT